MRELRGRFEVLLASSRATALELLAKTEGIEVVVSDLSMDEVDDGMKLLGEVLRRHPRCGRILVSGTSEIDIVERCLSTGTAHYYLSKPWSLGTLDEAISRVQQAAAPGGRQGGR